MLWPGASWWARVHRSMFLLQYTCGRVHSRRTLLLPCRMRPILRSSIAGCWLTSLISAARAGGASGVRSRPFAHGTRCPVSATTVARARSNAREADVKCKSKVCEVSKVG